MTLTVVALVKASKFDQCKVCSHGLVCSESSSLLHPPSTLQYFNHRHRCFLPRFLCRETRQSGRGLINVDNQRLWIAENLLQFNTQKRLGNIPG